MVDIDRIKEEDMTESDVLDRFTAQPQETVEWVPEWDEYLEERPGENTRIEDETLLWERDGFSVAMESHETTHWRVELEIPDRVGSIYSRPIDLKCHPRPEYGFVESVTIEDYAVTQAVLIIQEIHQPIYEVNAFIDELLEEAEENEQFMEDLEAGLDAARETEE